MLCVCAAVVIFCHSKLPVQASFLFRAQDRNMTNGDFAWFTFWPLPGVVVSTPWILYDRTRSAYRRQAFYVLKQVLLVILS